MSTSPLYIPADRERPMRRGRTHEGTVILDLEDGVAPSRKSDAIDAVLTFLDDPRPWPTWVRIESGDEGVDQARRLRHSPGLFGVWIAKAEDPQLVRKAAVALDEATEIGVLVESAPGILNLRELLAIDEVTAVQVGEIDLSADLRQPAHSAEGMEWVRNWVSIHAAAVGCALIGPVEANYSDLEGFRQSSQHLRELGYTARACIHPAQCVIADEVFRASEGDLRRAREIIDEFDRAIKDGRGAYGAAGSMVDTATVRSARRTLSIGS